MIEQMVRMNEDEQTKVIEAASVADLRAYLNELLPGCGCKPWSECKSMWGELCREASLEIRIEEGLYKRSLKAA